ncbi:MAG: MMPL family transporter [Thermococci archaeon]|nr:MMPL family transporter [Thermococci archaeon]
MGLADWISRHGKLVIGLWIIVMIVAVPVAAKVNNLLKYSTQQMLPNNAESVKAQNIMNRYFPSFAEENNQSYLIITGINVNSTSARKAYFELKRQSGPYASNMTSYYDIVDKLKNRSVSIAVNLTRLTANLTARLYNATLEMNSSYGTTLSRMKELKNATLSIKTALNQSALAYVELRKNLTMLYGEMVNLSRAINESAVAYAGLERNLTSLRERMLNLSRAINESALAYMGIRRNLTVLYGEMVNLSRAINETDAAYAATMHNLTILSERLRLINGTISSINSGIYTINSEYPGAYVGATEVYLTLRKLGAYERKALTPTEAELVANRTHTTPEFVYAVFNATLPVYTLHGYAGITDPLLANVTGGILAREVGNNGTALLLFRAYSTSFYAGVVRFDELHGSEYSLQALPPRQLEKAVASIAAQALKGVPEVILASNETVSMNGTVMTPQMLSRLVNLSIVIGEHPSPAKVENATVTFMLPYVPSVLRNQELLMELLITGPTRKLALSLVEEGMKEKAPPSMRVFVPVIANVTSKYDPNAEGTLTVNPGLLENATLTAVRIIGGNRTEMIGPTLLREIYENGWNSTVIDEAAKRLLLNQLVRRLSSSGVPEANATAELIVSAVSSNPAAVSGNSAVLENATVSIMEKLMGSRRLPESYLRELYESASSIGPIAEQLILDELTKKLSSSGVPDANLTARLIVSEATANPAVTENPGALENATVSVVMKLAGKKAELIGRENLIKLYSGGGKNVDEIAASLLLKNLESRMKAMGVQNYEKVAEAIVREVTANPTAIRSRPEVLENATVSVILSTAGNVTVPKGVNLRDIIERLYSGVSYTEVASSLFLKGVKDELASNTSVPANIREKMISIAEAIVKDYPLTLSEAESIVKNSVAAIIGPELKREPFMQNVSVSTIVSIAFRFRDSPKAVTGKDVGPLAAQIYSALYSTFGGFASHLVSRSGDTMLIVFMARGNTTELKYNNTMKVRALALRDFGRYFSNVTCYAGGTAVVTQESIKYGKKDVERTDKFSAGGALIVLFIIMGAALIATLLPFTGIGVAVFAGMAVLYLLAKGGLNVSQWTRTIMTTTALGLGVDYSTYYLHRFREYISEGLDSRKAAAEALRRSRDAVAASAISVIIAFASFLLAWNFPFMKSMGIVVPIAVAIIFTATLTLIPAIAAEFGERSWFWWPRSIEHVRRAGRAKESRFTKTVIRGAVIVLIGALILGIPAANYFVHFKGSHDIKLWLPKGSQTLNFLELSQEKLGASVSTPNYIIVEFKQPVNNETLREIAAMSRHLEGMKWVTAVYSPTQPYGKPLPNMTLASVKHFGGSQYISKGDRMVIFEVISRYSSGTEQARQLVKNLRAYLKGLKANGTIETYYVGGLAAIDVDVDNIINHDFWHKVFPVAIVAMFFALIPVIRGVPAVGATIITIFLGSIWSIWVSDKLFRGLFNQPMAWFMPMIIFIVLLGVGVDYNNFFLIKARDEYERRNPKDALAYAAGSVDKLIVGLASVLAVTYGSLMLSSNWGTRELGFNLALGVLLTSLSAVYIVTPAFMSLFGRKAWWPFRIRMKTEEAKTSEAGETKGKKEDEKGNNDKAGNDET